MILGNAFAFVSSLMDSKAGEGIMKGAKMITIIISFSNLSLDKSWQLSPDPWNMEARLNTISHST